MNRKWLAAPVIAAVLAATGCGALDELTAGEDNSAKIAEATGASQCHPTDFDLTNKLDSSRSRVYDCTIDGVQKCVIWEGGIAHDETAAAKLLFSQNLSGGRPECAR